MVRWVVGSILYVVDPLSYFTFQPMLHDMLQYIGISPFLVTLDIKALETISKGICVFITRITFLL